MKLYEVNREERHFGFLFLTALISYPDFRRAMFTLMNERASMTMDPQSFDVYAEVAIFRDHWNSLGNQNQYNEELNAKRQAVLDGILRTMEINPALVKEEDLFWTGKVGSSKLWYPGKWAEAKIHETEARRGIESKRLWRCRWLCNAKPDVMIHSGNDVLFIEVKVESGMGASDNGYAQEQTQKDIITVGKRVIDWMKNGTVRRINLTHHEDKDGITWKQVIDVFSKTRPRPDIGSDMIERHLDKMPKSKET